MTLVAEAKSNLKLKISNWKQPRNITGEKGCLEKVDVEILRSAKDDTAQACGDTGQKGGHSIVRSG
jgi:hypothetical protein